MITDHKPKTGLPRWYDGHRQMGYTYPGWITLIVLTPDVAVVRRPGATTWTMTAKEWLALKDDAP